MITALTRYYQRFALAGLLCLSSPALASVTFTVCHDFGCRDETLVTLDTAEWATVRALFVAANAKEERLLIRYALGYMEYLAGRYSPVHGDVARNLPPGVNHRAELGPGQLDCIDESINATRFLRLFEEEGLLQYHRVLDRAYRRSFVTQHWAAEVEDVTSGRRFVYDTWFADNGRPPVMVSSPRWYNLYIGANTLNLEDGSRSTSHRDDALKQR